MKKFAKLLVIAGIACVIIAAAVLILIKTSNPAPPAIKHAEFPFEIKYEMNGNIYSISDTVVCDFDKTALNAGWFGNIREWNTQLKSGTSRIYFLRGENIRSVLKPDRVDTKISVYYNFGAATYFMGDPRGSNFEKPSINYYEEYMPNPKTTVVDSTPLTKEDLQKYFGITIISWSFSPPITNTFK